MPRVGASIAWPPAVPICTAEETITGRGSSPSIVNSPRVIAFRNSGKLFYKIKENTPGENLTSDDFKQPIPIYTCKVTVHSRTYL